MVKVGIRKPSVKKSIKARTTGKAKRTVKKAVNPTYGKKGTGWVKNPKKAAYNKVYNKTTKSVTDFSSSSKRKRNSSYSYEKEESSGCAGGCGCWSLIFGALIALILVPLFPITAGFALLLIVVISLIKLGSKPKNVEQENINISDDEFDDHWDKF